VAAHVTIAAKRRQHVLMAEILRPGLILLWRLAFLSAEQRQRLPEAVGLEIRQAAPANACLKMVLIGLAVLQ
jgi:hypothetical protein